MLNYKTISKAALIINALVFMLIGVMFTFWPEKYVQGIFIEMLNESAVIEIRTQYGALSWGFGLFILINLVKNEHVKSAVLASGTVLLCMGIVRIGGIMLAENPSQLMQFFAGLELFGGAVFTLLCLKFPNTSK